MINVIPLIRHSPSPTILPFWLPKFDSQKPKIDLQWQSIKYKRPKEVDVPYRPEYGAVLAKNGSLRIVCGGVEQEEQGDRVALHLLIPLLPLLPLLPTIYHEEQGEQGDKDWWLCGWDP